MKLAKKHCLLLTGSFLLFLIATGASAAGFSLSGVGSKAIGMGGAFRGLADDYSAAYWNPAGLATQKGFELSFTGVGIVPNFTLKPNVPQPGYAQERREAKNDPVLIPNAAFFTDVGKLSWLTFGVAGYVPAGLRTGLDLYDLPLGFGNPTPFPEYEWESKLEIFDVHPSLAASLLGGRLSIGVGGSIQYGSATLRRPIFQQTLRGVAFDLLPPGLKELLEQADQSPQKYMPIDTLMDGTGWGYGINGGILLKPISTLSLGLSGRSQSTFTLDGETVFSLYTPGNERLAQTLQSVPDPKLKQLAVLYSGQVFQTKGIGTTEIILPADIGIGVAWQPCDAFTLTGDATWTGWSGFEDIRIELEGIDLLGTPVTERVIPEQWEDVVRFSAGFEIRPLSALAIRGGYYLDPSPIPEETQGPLIPDIGDKHSINAGIGLKLGALGIDVNYEYIIWPDRTVNPFDVDGDGEIDSLPGDYSMSLHSVMSTLTLAF